MLMVQMSSQCSRARAEAGQVGVLYRPGMRGKVAGCLRFGPVFCFVLLLGPALVLRGQAVVVPAATVLSIQLRNHVAMKSGEPLEGALLYPVFVENHLVLPAGTIVRGHVTELVPDRGRRIHSRLRGDLTPFRKPVVRFDELVLPGGSVRPIVIEEGRGGAPILRLSPPPGQKKGSFVVRQLDAEKQRLRDTVSQFTAPGRGDRLVQFVYTQLPWHPQRIETGTAWAVCLAKPFDLMAAEVPPVAPIASEPGAESGRTEWHLHAYLERTIGSGSNKPGDRFRAVVSEPVLDGQRNVVVPQGSLLVGEVTQAKAARSFARQGKLRFRFREMQLPTGFTQPVKATLAGVDSDKSAELQIDAEGGVQPKSQNRVLLPLVLTILAGRALDDDGSRALDGAVASNGFGLVGRVVGIVASSRNVAAGIGIYGAALSFYDLWLAHGHNVVFVKNTRIEVTTTPSQSPMSVAPPAP